jgi:hypothetical protein
MKKNRWGGWSVHMIPDAIKAMLRMTIKDVRAVRLIVGGKDRWRSIDGCLKPFAEK